MALVIDSCALRADGQLAQEQQWIKGIGDAQDAGRIDHSNKGRLWGSISCPKGHDVIGQG